MKATELRIGNYYTFTGWDSIRDVQIQESLLQSQGFWRDFNDGLFKPIHLTEEWLLKFGYKDLGSIIENEFESYKRFSICFSECEHEVHIIKSTYGGTNYIEYVTSIDGSRQYNWRMEFVHDLQNAVYKETGEELVTK